MPDWNVALIALDYVVIITLFCGMIFAAVGHRVRLRLHPLADKVNHQA